MKPISTIVRGGLLVLLLLATAAVADEKNTSPQPLIGYTEFRTDLPGGRHANVATMRRRRRQARTERAGESLAEELAREPDAWTQFAGWSPDGRLADHRPRLGEPRERRVGGGAQDLPLHRRRLAATTSYLVDLATGKATNVTAVDRVSFHNTGLFFWPGDPTKLGFQALIDGNSHPFRMDRDGRNKRDLTKDSKEFAYGFSASPDGKRIAYHKNYQVYLADADGSNARRGRDRPAVQLRAAVVAGRHTRLLFLAGEHYNCHPHVVRGRRHRPAEARRPRRLPGRGRVPRRARLPRRQQRHAGLVGRRQVGLLHGQGRPERRAVPRRRSTARASG